MSDRPIKRTLRGCSPTVTSNNRVSPRAYSRRRFRFVVQEALAVEG